MDESGRRIRQTMLEQGLTRKQAKGLIGDVLLAEVFEILSGNVPFNKERFVKNLSRLPDLSK